MSHKTCVTLGVQNYKSDTITEPRNYYDFLILAVNLCWFVGLLHLRSKNYYGNCSFHFVHIVMFAYNIWSLRTRSPQYQ